MRESLSVCIIELQQHFSVPPGTSAAFAAPPPHSQGNVNGHRGQQWPPLMKICLDRRERHLEINHPNFRQDFTVFRNLKFLIFKIYFMISRWFFSLYTRGHGSLCIEQTAHTSSTCVHIITVPKEPGIPRSPRSISFSPATDRKKKSQRNGKILLLDTFSAFKRPKNR